MRGMAWLVVVLPGWVGACDGAMNELSADDALTLRAISGEEEDLAEGESVLAGADEAHRPPLFRVCDAQGALDEQFASFDEDSDGLMSGVEQREVEGRGGERRHKAHAWRMLLDVYDLDADRSLADEERATLLEDFTVRCEVLHERLLAEFDTDGDGALSEAERSAVHEAREQRCEEREHGGPPADDTDAAQGEARPPRGAPPGGPEGAGDSEAGAQRPDPMDAWDTDGDGLISEAELSEMRAVMRERIRDGAPLRPDGRLHE
jgi:Ca2+-binding EF-hand superfamily protein